MDDLAEQYQPGDTRPRSWRRDELASWLPPDQADAGLRAELRVLAGETTDDLDQPS
jgi:hypothetical protein